MTPAEAVALERARIDYEVRQLPLVSSAHVYVGPGSHGEAAHTVSSAPVEVDRAEVLRIVAGGHVTQETHK